MLQERQSVKRRSVLSALGSIIWTSGITLEDNYDPIDLEVKIWATDKLLDHKSSDEIDVREIVSTQVQSSLNSLANTTRKIDSVSVEPAGIVSGIDGETSLDVFAKWEHMIESHDNAADDANLLLHHAEDKKETGRGEITHCHLNDEQSCNNNSVNASVVFNARDLYEPWTDGEFAPKKYANYGTDFAKTLMVAVHEVGHNLGFTHDMGSVKSTKINEVEYVVISPMVGLYYFNDKGPSRGHTNRFGRRLEEIDKRFVVWGYQFSDGIYENIEGVIYDE